MLVAFLSLSLFLPGVSRMRKHTRARTLLVCSSCWEGMEEEEEEEKDFSSFLLKEEKR
jgi:predicted metal-binding protein